MAYIDIHDRFSGPAAALAPAVEAPEAKFTALEWNVIALAKRDSVRSLGAPGAFSRALGGLFGLGAHSRLADPRLEALRHVAVHAWRRGFAIPKAEIARFLEAGYSESQLERMVESITGWRVQPRRAA